MKVIGKLRWGVAADYRIPLRFLKNGLERRLTNQLIRYSQDVRVVEARGDRIYPTGAKNTRVLVTERRSDGSEVPKRAIFPQPPSRMATGFAENSAKLSLRSQKQRRAKTAARAS
jgi:hypothetical protein